MIDIKPIEQIDRVAWGGLLASSDTASFFQTPECYDFYKSLSFMEPFGYGVTENNSLVGLCCGYIVAEGSRIKRYLTRRAIIPGGLLLNTNVSEVAVTALLSELNEGLKHRVIYIEIRNYADYSYVNHYFEKAGFAYRPHLNIQVPTVGIKEAFGKLSASKRRQLRLNEKAGVVCYESKNGDDLKAFYSILADLYKVKIRKPLFPYSFFEDLLKKSFSHFFVVKKNGKVLGGIVCVAYNDEILYEWFVCGDDKSKLGVYPTLAATWKAIEYASANGFAYFDFMGAGKPNEPYGVREFKSRFGGRIVEYGRYECVHKPLFMFVGKTGLLLYK